MLPSRLNKLFLLILMFLSSGVIAQELIGHVSISKTGTDSYRIRYSLNTPQAEGVNEIQLKIFRRRNGSVEEVFSRVITPDRTVLEKNRNFYYDWKTDEATVKQGDELQAKILVSYLPAVAKNDKRNNLPPIADAGDFTDLELPLAGPVLLDGSKSFDEDGRIVSQQWKQVAGPATLKIVRPDSVKTAIEGEWKPGTYIFELHITDNKGATATGRTLVKIKPAPAIVRQPPPVQKKDSLIQPVMNQPPVVTRTKPLMKEPTGRLKGGPLNAAINLLVPGLGHYFVSGDHRGNNRKPAVLGIAVLYAGSIGGAFYFQSSSDKQYEKYLELANYREYQREPNGAIIGVRGADQALANQYLKKSRSHQKNALILLGLGGGILVGDALYTYFKGLKNKAAWKKEATSFRPEFFISPDGAAMAAGIRIQF